MPRTSEWQTRAMAKTDTDRYSITIEPSAIGNQYLEYYIEVKDTVNSVTVVLPKLLTRFMYHYPAIPIPMVMVSIMRRMRSPMTLTSQVISTGMVLEIIPIRMMMGMVY